MIGTLNPVLEEPELEEDTGVRPYQWTVERFYRAIEAGIFEHPERLELIEGEIIEKVAAQETPHCQATLLARDVLEEIFGLTCHIRTGMPLDIGKSAEPEPDVFVVRGQTRDFDRRKPQPGDVKLLMEISDTTLGYDRHRKAALYAEAGVEEYWILNLRGRCLEVRRDPLPMPNSKYGFGYRTTILYTEDDTASPLAAPDAAIRVGDLLPRPAPQE